MQYSERLREACDLAGLTTRQVADRMQTAGWPTGKSAVSTWLTGEHVPQPREKAIALHALLGIGERAEAEAEWVAAGGGAS